MIKSADRLSNFGEYYFSKKLEEIREMNNSGEQVINLGIGSPDLAPPAEVIDVLKQSSSDPANHNYQPYRSIESLRIAVGEFYGKHYNVHLNPKNEILPLLGSKEGVMYVSMAFLNPGDIALVPNPGYPSYGAVAKMIGAKPVYYDLDSGNDWAPNFDEIDPEVLEKAKILWVNYPNMPTGTKGSDELYQKIIEFGRKNDILICNDNPYSFILNDEPKSMLSFDESREHVVELNSLSKTFNMSGWRVGMICGHPQYVGDILTVKSNVDSGMFKPVQEAAIEALKVPKSWFETHDEIYGERRKCAFELLDSFDCTYNNEQVGLFIWAKLPEGVRSEDFIDHVLKQSRVFITPGTIFGSNGEGYVRVSLCSPVEQFEKAMERLKVLKRSESVC